MKQSRRLLALLLAAILVFINTPLAANATQEVIPNSNPPITPSARLVLPTNSVFDAPQYGEISLVKFSAVANGCMGGIALDSMGRVWTWGYNLYGQLGIGRTVLQQRYYGGMKRIPYFPQNNIKIIEIGASYETRYALGDNGLVYAWGHGASGAMGNGTSTATNTTPTAVPGLSNVKQIFVSDSYTLQTNIFVLTETGDLYAWGDNANSLLGFSSTATRNTPSLVPLPAELAGREIVKVVCGRTSAFILDDQGDLWGSGNDTYGQQGNGPSSGGNTSFTKMNRNLSGMGRVVDIDLSYVFTGYTGDRVVSLDENSNVWEWGGTFGDGSGPGIIVSKQTPQKITLDPAEVAKYGYTPIPQSVTASEMVCYFIDQHGRPWGWGSGYYFGFGRDGGYETSNDERINSQSAKQVPKIIGDGDTQTYDYNTKLPVYKGGGVEASTRHGYGFNDLHPTIYDEKYMVKNQAGNPVDAEGNPLKRATATTLDGLSNLTAHQYYRSTGGVGTANRITAPATVGVPAIDPKDWLWIKLAFQPVPFISQMDCTLSAYSFLDADGNLFKWGNDGSGSVAWGWDYDSKYDFNGNTDWGLYDRYTYEVMYMRGAPMIDPIDVKTTHEKKIYTNPGQPAVNPVNAQVTVPASTRSDSLEQDVFSDLTELKYVVIPYDENSAAFNLAINSLTVSQFMALYTTADASLKGELLNGRIHSTSIEQILNYSINAPQNGRIIVYAATERYASNDDGITQDYLKKTPVFMNILVDNVYTAVNVQHQGDGEDPAGNPLQVYAPTNDTVVKTNNDSADTGKPFDAKLYGLPLDALGNVIGVTKNPNGTITSLNPPTFGYDQIAIASYESAGYPPESNYLDYWQWMNTVSGTTQEKTGFLSLDDTKYGNSFVHPFYYERNNNWTPVSGTKKWDDFDDTYETRPASIMLTLKQYERNTSTGAKGAFIQDVETITVGSNAEPDTSNVWSFVFSSIYPSYEYTYEVVETPIDLYNTSVEYKNLIISGSLTAEDFTGIEITNTLKLKPVLLYKTDNEGNAITSDIACFTLTNTLPAGIVFDKNGVPQPSLNLDTDTTNGTIIMPLQLPGIYHLKETKAPAGYNLLTKEVVITIDANGKINATLGSLDLVEVALSEQEASKYSAAFKILNKEASELPLAGTFGLLALNSLLLVSLLATNIFLHNLRKSRKRQRFSSA